MSGTAGNDRRMQVVMLGLGAEVFAVEADMVREIIDPVPVTRVAGARARGRILLPSSTCAAT